MYTKRIGHYTAALTGHSGIPGMEVIAVFSSSWIGITEERFIASMISGHGGYETVLGQTMNLAEWEPLCAIEEVLIPSRYTCRYRAYF